MELFIPFGVLRNEDEDAAAKRRREIAASLRRGEALLINASGQALLEDEAEKDEDGNVMNQEVPAGKLA